ncbi:MAG: lipopolysaccharide heptosyltransferase II [Syntrophaceae bacterium]|nr:lipopolysaccharide heptosyltransferase II [Syntrophaceae bacterium]
MRGQRILILRLSAVGDVIRTLPAVKALKEHYPSSSITWIVEEPSRALLESQPEIDEVILFPRRRWAGEIRSARRIWGAIGEMVGFIKGLRRRRFDMVLDFHGILKSGLLSVLSGSPRRIGFDRRSSKEGNFFFSNIKVTLPDLHISRFQKNFELLRGVGLEVKDFKSGFCIPVKDREYINQFFNSAIPPLRRPIISIHPGTSPKTCFKRWMPDQYSQLADRLVRQLKATVIFTWGPGELDLVEGIQRGMKEPSLLGPPTESLTQLAEIFRRSHLFIGGDTGPMYIASLLGTPIVVIYGPTDPVLYEPLGLHKKVRKEVGCNPCRNRSCRELTCLKMITVDDVFRAAEEILCVNPQPIPGLRQGRRARVEVQRRRTLKPIPNSAIASPRRILVRGVNWVGDTILTYPTIQGLKAIFPDCHLTILAPSHLAELWRTFPYVDEVIHFQKRKGIGFLWEDLRLASSLREKRFDLAVILPRSFHSAFQVYLARIPIRIGYQNRGRSFLITHGISRTEEVLRIHRVLYYRRLIDPLGRMDGFPPPRIFLRDEDRRWAEERLKEMRLLDGRVLVGMNPGAAYGSAKCWDPDRFGELGRRVSSKWKATVLLFGRDEERPMARAILQHLKEGGTDLTGRTGLLQLAALLERCHLLVTNDTGTMHVAAAVGTPVVAIFGSTDPLTTGPWGEGNIVVKKDVSCSPCSKRICPTDHRCMKLITVDEVEEAVGRKLRELDGRPGTMNDERGTMNDG